jgi:hypothetical protein
MTVAHKIINLIIVIAGVIAAAGGLWAARAAHRSAVTHKRRLNVRKELIAVDC